MTQSSWVNIPMAGAQEAMPAFLEMPVGEPKGGLVMLQEIFGVNEAMRSKAKRFADAGYATLVPDLFWRLQPRIELNYSEDDRKRGFGLMQQFDQSQGADDTNAAANWLEKRLGAGSPISVVGFCLGGRIAVLAADKNRNFKSVISFYGVKLDECTTTISALSMPFQFHVGDKDAHIPSSAIDAVQQAVLEKPGADVFVYSDAKHGFFNSARADVYSHDAARLAEQRSLNLLKDVS